MSMVGSVATLKAVTEAAPRETGGEVSGSPLLVTGRVPRSEFERGDLRANCRTRKLADAENRAAGVSAAPKGTQATWGRLLPLPRNGRYAPSTAVGRKWKQTPPSRLCSLWRCAHTCGPILRVGLLPSVRLNRPQIASLKF